MVADESQNDRTRSFVALTAGTEISHYKIISKIGSGGMGEVYLAQDTELDRKVALKFLPPHLCADEECRARFKREAQAAAKLDHPNIISVYEVSDYQGRPYFVMAHVEGRSLKEYLEGRDLEIERIVELAIQVCEGLQAAHEKGVTHRDIKPSNILIDSYGRARIVDFGLAAVKGTDQLTKTGSTMGTIGYMSPEQVRGQQVDHRSDLFSLGVVLYELITQQNPFKRDSEAATLKALSDDTPHPVARYRADIPDDLQVIFDKLLEKDVKTRYQHADGLLSDLMRIKRSMDMSRTTGVSIAPAKKSKAARWVVATVVVIAAIAVLMVGKPWMTGGASKGSDKIMLAVLPFENLGDPEDEYFADGMTREISSRLASVRRLGVIAHASAATYKNTDKPLDQIADELGVAYVLDGSIQWDKSGDTNLVRVAPQLIRVDDQTQVWASNYERILTRIFQVQTDIARDITRALGMELTTAQRDVITDNLRIDPRAYSYYLRAIQYFSWIFSNFNFDFILSSERLLTNAIEIEPDFAEAHARLSMTHTVLYRSGFDHTGERLKKARASVERAQELAPDLVQTRLAQGWFYYYGPQRYDSAEAAFSRVLDIEPDNSEANCGLARVLRRSGHFDEAQERLKTAIRFDPKQAIYLTEMAFGHRWSHRHKEAVQWYEKAIELEPDNRRAYGGLALATLHSTGNPIRARNVLYRALRTARRWPSLTYAEAEFYFLERNYDSAFSTLTGPDDVQKDYGIIDGPDSAGYYTLKAEICQSMSNPARARSYYDSARTILEAIPPDSSYHYAHSLVNLGVIYARLGFPEQAVNATRLASELSVKDKLLYGYILYGQAVVLTISGEYDEAIGKLDEFLSAPSWGSTNWLKLDPRFDPLREHPRFQALISKYEKIHGT